MADQSASFEARLPRPVSTMPPEELCFFSRACGRVEETALVTARRPSRSSKYQVRSPRAHHRVSVPDLSSAGFGRCRPEGRTPVGLPESWKRPPLASISVSPSCSRVTIPRSRRRECLPSRREGPGPRSSTAPGAGWTSHEPSTCDQQRSELRECRASPRSAVPSHLSKLKQKGRHLTS